MVMKRARFHPLNRLVRATELTSHICSFSSTQSGFFSLCVTVFWRLIALFSLFGLFVSSLLSPHPGEVRGGGDREGTVTKIHNTGLPCYHLLCVNR